MAGPGVVSESWLTPGRIVEAAAAAGLDPLPAGAAERFSFYYRLLDQWNSKLNLTAIRTAEEVLRRHFLECIFCAQHLAGGVETLLDFGSGAGFPGVPVAICRPEIRVTLAESQGKKASFLREVVRSLGIDAEVYLGRVEEMAAVRSFDVVALRAVDRMGEAIQGASARVRAGGWLVVLGTDSADVPSGFSLMELAVPGSDRGRMIVGRKD